MENLVVQAERLGHTVLWYRFARIESMALREEDGRCVIGINPDTLRGSADGRVKLAHELGHCETGAFYTRSADRAAVGRREERADRWAIQRLIPYRALCAALADGYTDLWSLSDHFAVTEAFMQKALHYYRDVKALPLCGRAACKEAT